MSFGNFITEDIDLASALQTVGAEIARISYVTKENGQNLLDPESNFVFNPQTRDKVNNVKNLAEAWRDTEKVINEHGGIVEPEFVKTYERALESVKLKSPSEAQTLEQYLPFMVIMCIRTFLLNRESVEVAFEKGMPEMERKIQTTSTQRKLNNAVRAVDKLNKYIKRYKRKLALNPPPKYFPKLVSLDKEDIKTN